MTWPVDQGWSCTLPDVALITVGLLENWVISVPDVRTCTTPEEAEMTVGLLESVTVPLLRERGPEVRTWTSPDDALTTGTLKLGALDQGFVATVVATMSVPEVRTWSGPEVSVWTSPELAETTLIPAVVYRLTPDEVTGMTCTRPELVFRTVTVPVNVKGPDVRTGYAPVVRTCTLPELAETTLMPAVVYKLTPDEVTGITCTRPELVLFTVTVPESVRGPEVSTCKGPVVSTVGSLDRVIVPEDTCTRSPAEVVTTASPLELTESPIIAIWRSVRPMVLVSTFLPVLSGGTWT